MLELEKSNLILHLIRKKTKSDKVPLQKLCYGICDISYISRAIANNTEIDKLILDALMQRLGISSRNYIYMLRDSEYEYFVYREQIRTCIQENRIEKAKILLETYMDMQKKIKGAKKLHYNKCVESPLL